MAEGEGYGQMRPETGASDYNALTFVMRTMISKLDTVKIVKVQAVDTAAKTVQVIPMVEQLDGNNQVTAQGTIYAVPYMRWQYGINAVIADPAVDDIGILLCADRDISVVKETKETGPPGSERQYDRSDGVYLGGLFGEDPEQYVKFTDTGMELHDKNGNGLVSGPVGWTFTGNVVIQQNLLLGGDVLGEDGNLYPGDIHIGGTMKANTDVQSGTISLNSHHHTAQGAFAPTTVSQP